jgi:hypothetical protein
LCILQRPLNAFGSPPELHEAASEREKDKNKEFLGRTACKKSRINLDPHYIWVI